MRGSTGRAPVSLAGHRPAATPLRAITAGLRDVTPWLTRKARTRPLPSSGHMSETIGGAASDPLPVCRAALPPGAGLAPYCPAGCHVRRADITTESHLRPVPGLALDTRGRNGHASDQAQLTVLRTLVRCRVFPHRDAFPPRSGGLMTVRAAKSREARMIAAS
jgi:hypothetical protein